jgi:hypothetical protein
MAKVVATNGRSESMKVERFGKGEFLEVLREEGVIMGSVVMDFPRFISLCHRHGFHSSQFGFLFL